MEIVAKYSGRCRVCGGAISVGETIEWERGEGAAHPDCLEPPADAPYYLSGGEGYGYTGWETGRTYRVDRSLPAYRDWPEFVTVVKAGATYCHEDGMSHGVGDEQGYIYWAWAREATEEEAEAVREIIRRREERREAQRRLDQIIRHIQETAGHPDGEHFLEGETLFDTRDIYGNGWWLVVGPKGIWYIRHRDGVGWRVPYSEDLENELRELAEKLG